jgi:NADH-quinone oxidoreductase subunit J
MNAVDILFYLFGAITLLSAMVTVFSKSLVYSAFSLVFTFFGVAGMYVLLNADFLAITQLLVYVGGILILLIFGVMLTNRITTMDIRSSAGARIPAGLIGIGLLVAIGGVIMRTKWITHLDKPWAMSPWGQDANMKVLGPLQGSAAELARGQGSQGTSMEIGKLFLTDYLLPFEVVSVVLLIALIGAAMIARKEPEAVIEREVFEG